MNAHIPSLDEYKPKEKVDSEKIMRIPLVCMNFPEQSGTYGLIYVELNNYDKIAQLKNIIAREFFVHPKSIRVFHKGSEMSDDLVVSLGRFGGEIIFFSITPQIIRTRPEFYFEK